MWVFKIMPKCMAIRMARSASPTYPNDEITRWVDSKLRVSCDFLNSMTSMGMETAAPFEVFRMITVPAVLFIGDKKRSRSSRRVPLNKLQVQTTRSK